MSAQRTVGPPSNPSAQSQSLTVELSSPPTYWIGFDTDGSLGSRRGKTDSPAGTAHLNTSGKPSAYDARQGRVESRCTEALLDDLGELGERRPGLGQRVLGVGDHLLETLRAEAVGHALDRLRD